MKIPALLTTTCGPPWRAAESANTRAQSSSRVTSWAANEASPPPSRMPRAVAAPASSRTSVTTTAAPAAASARAVSAPIPRAAPVTIAVRPVNAAMSPLPAARRREHSTGRRFDNPQSRVL